MAKKARKAKQHSVIVPILPEGIVLCDSHRDGEFIVRVVETHVFDLKVVARNRDEAETLASIAHGDELCHRRISNQRETQVVGKIQQV